MTYVQHVNLLVNDLDEAVEFYETILGFPKCFTPPFDFPAQFVAIGEHSEIHINELEDVKPYLGHFAVRLTNFNEVFMRAHEAGVFDTEALSPPRFIPGGLLQAFIRDPSGNMVEITPEAGVEIDPAIPELDIFDKETLVHQKQ